MVTEAGTLPGQTDLPEISDLIAVYDIETLARKSVSKAAVLTQLKALGQRQAIKVVESLPTNDEDILDPGTIDEMLIRGHREIQRLHEEFHLGYRVLEVLVPMVVALRATKVARPIRVIDVGCGLGFLVRWLAAKGCLGDDVELLGYDFNTALVAESQRLAKLESLRCEFRVGNAFRLNHDDTHGPTVFLSTVVLHHFRGNDLVAFFRNQESADAFIHFDIDPSWLAPIGARIFHWARMREPLVKNDGVLSALRAHSGKDLLKAARQGTSGHRVVLFRVGSKVIPITRTIRPVIGVRPPLWDAWREALGDGAQLIREQA